MNLKTCAGKSQRSFYICWMTREHLSVTPGAVDVHLGNKGRSRLSVKPGRKIEEEKNQVFDDSVI